MKALSTTVFLSLFLVLFSSCEKQQGCTDPSSYTYDSEAEEDDGSCKYRYGGKDYGQLDIGSLSNMGESYDIYFNGDFIGTLNHYWNDPDFCADPDAIGRVMRAGNVLIEAKGNSSGTILYTTARVDAQECQTEALDYFQTASGGGGGNGSEGYNCVNGSCNFVSSNAQYSTYSACANACGGGGGGSDEGDLSFWLNQDLGCGYITVNISSYGSKTISSYYSSGNPGCGATGCANFYGLSYGAYSYTASSSSGCTWSGNVQVDRSCSTVQLSL